MSVEVVDSLGLLSVTENVPSESPFLIKFYLFNHTNDLSNGFTKTPLMDPAEEQKVGGLESMVACIQ